MRLPAATLTTDQKLQEFDVWITPSLGDVRQTPQFTDTLASIVRALDRLCAASNDFARESELDHRQIADNLVAQFTSKTPAEVLQILLDLASVLFLIVESGRVLVPGYGPFHGVRAADLHVAARNIAPALAADWPSAAAFEEDLAWLAARGYAIVHP